MAGTLSTASVMVVPAVAMMTAGRSRRRANSPARSSMSIAPPASVLMTTRGINSLSTNAFILKFFRTTAKLRKSGPT